MKKYFQALYWLSLAKRIYAVIPKRIRNYPLINRISDCVLSERFFTDPLYRTKFLLYPGFVANLLYATMQLVLGLCYRSIWSGSLALYYGMLAVIRVQLLKPIKYDTKTERMMSELQRYRLCGLILLCMTPLFASILILVVHKNGGAQYPGFTIVIMGIYTLCLLVTSISNLLKIRKYKRPILSAAKIVSLTATLMSVLSFSTALAEKFGSQSSDYFKKGLVGTAGGAVCVIILTVAIYMVVHSSKQFSALRNMEKR